MEEVYLLLGTNMGHRMRMLHEAILHISEQVGEVLTSSSVYESQPWGFDAEQRFLNQVIIVQTAKLPKETLRSVKDIERQMGRKKSQTTGYESRVIDIDILFYGQLTCQSEELTIPHSLLQERRFALAPLVEVSPQKIHPVFQKTMQQLLDECPDTSNVYKIQ